MDGSEPKIIKLGKGQAKRLSKQHVSAGGVVGIFGTEAQQHDGDIRVAAKQVLGLLEKALPTLRFRFRTAISKEEIHKRLHAVDERLGTSLFVSSASLEPDGGVTEVQDLRGEWRVVLVGESKHQGNDVKNIGLGLRTAVMEEKGQYIMPAGNAIERVHKNIQELKNFMLGERHFPYVVLLQGSNFCTETVTVAWPDGPEISIKSSDSNVNRIDRVTAANYGMAINQNHCQNLVIETPAGPTMLQVVSIYAQCEAFAPGRMRMILADIALTSLEILSDQLDISEATLRESLAELRKSLLPA